jgi:hypothetical protein
VVLELQLLFGLLRVDILDVNFSIPENYFFPYVVLDAQILLFLGQQVASLRLLGIGALAQASASVVNMREESASRWKKAFLALVTACIVFNQASPIFQESITAGEQIVKEITSAISDGR